MTNAITLLRRGIIDFLRHMLNVLGQRLGRQTRATSAIAVFDAYMDQTEALARQYERQAPVYRTEDLEALYDDAYFDALERHRQRS